MKRPPIDPDKLLALPLPDTEQSYCERDVMLYALGIGLGRDPCDRRELDFVYERQLKVLPTFPVVLGFDPYLLQGTGIDYTMLVHGEEQLTLHQLPEAAGTIVAKHRICDVIDKGEGKGALVVMERDIIDKPSGEAIATIRQSIFLRGDGGFGVVRPSPPVHALPDRAPDHICDLVTRPDMALLYRLSGDSNPLHADPDVAKAAGFDRPILHGLATFGVAGHALLRTLCDYDPARLVAIAGRFTAPVYPGETVRTEMWHDADRISYRVSVPERGVTAINNGWAQLR